MAIGANSYGSVDEVEAMTGRYLRDHAYDSSTRPTLKQVETFIDNASATLNVMLAKAGFVIPISQASAKAACGQLVVEVVVDLCHAANSTGRFFTERALERGIAPMVVLRREMADWVAEMAPGLELLGAARSYSQMDGIAFRDTDNSGAETSPIFSRKGFGNSFDDWDPD